MKKILILLITLFVITSCINDDDFKTQQADLKNIAPFIEKTAIIKEDYLTIIKSNEDTIVVTRLPIKYSFPKGTKETILYRPLSIQKIDMPYGLDIHQYTVAFEDTRNGDNDYNDFVCFITRQKEEIGNWPEWTVKITMYIQPIAFGAGTTLQFGMTLPNGIDTIFTNNIQRDMFPNTTGFVNTTDVTDIYETADTNHIIKYTYYQIGRSYQTYNFHPFIINSSGEKFYAITNSHSIGSTTNILSITGYPMGIATPGAFLHPMEKINIVNGYSGFNNWIMGNSTTIGNVTNQNNVFYTSNWGNGGIIDHQPQKLFKK